MCRISTFIIQQSVNKFNVLLQIPAKCVILDWIHKNLQKQRSDFSVDPSAAIQIIVLIFLLLGSAFFSSAETSLTTVNKIKMRSLAEEGDKLAKMVI